VNELFDGLRVRWICKKLGFERLSLKNNKLRCYFMGNPQSSFFESTLFQNIIKYVSVEGQLKGYSLKQSRNYLILIKDRVHGLKKARILLQELHASVQETSLAE
jgi:transcription-repair coupling factor (superfamily II helicase)